MSIHIWKWEEVSGLETARTLNSSQRRESPSCQFEGKFMLISLIIIYFSQIMPKNVSWTSQEDYFIIQLVKKYQCESVSGNVSWQEVARQLQDRIGTGKTARQCQHRWNYSLRSGINKQFEWSQSQQNLLFELQQIHGNKWTLIAEKLEGKAEHQVKNHFYATLRKSIRNINSHISMNRGEIFFKGRKPFSQASITKIVSLEQGKDKRLKTNGSDVTRLATSIKSNLLRLITNQEDRDLIKKTIEQLTEFNRNCRKIKGKKNSCMSDSDISFEGYPSPQKRSKVVSKVKEDQGSISEEECLQNKSVKPILKEQESQIHQYQIKPNSFLNSSDFWMASKIESEQCHFVEEKRSFFDNEKKDWPSLARTRDVEDDEEEIMQAQEVKGVKLGWDIQLPIEDILSLPGLDDMLEKKEAEEEFIIFGDMNQSRNEDQDDMNYQAQCPFNEYFS